MAFIDMVRRSLCLLCNPNKSCLCNDGVLPRKKIREIEITYFFPILKNDDLIEENVL